MNAAHPTRLRAVLIAGFALSIGIAAWVGDPAVHLQADPALAQLLRGMAVIKGAVVLGAVGIVFWRFGWNVSKRVAVAYALGSCVLAGSTMLIWQLTFIAPAAILFHAAALCMLVVAGRDLTA